jgi:hypothetical protein
MIIFDFDGLNADGAMVFPMNTVGAASCAPSPYLSPTPARFTSTAPLPAPALAPAMAPVGEEKLSFQQMQGKLCVICNQSWSGTNLPYPHVQITKFHLFMLCHKAHLISSVEVKKFQQLIDHKLDHLKQNGWWMSWLRDCSLMMRRSQCLHPHATASSI